MYIFLIEFDPDIVDYLECLYGLVRKSQLFLVAKRMITTELHRQSCAINVHLRRLAHDPHGESITLHLALTEWRGGSEDPAFALPAHHRRTKN
jgi:hypothetical protein